MEISTILEILGLLAGGGGLGVFFSWRYLKRQEAAKTKEQEANAVTAEVTATKEMQDVYQQMVQDLKDAWKEQKEYIGELNEDRRNLRGERDELRAEIAKLEKVLKELRKEQREQADKIARLGRIVEVMKPLVCAKVDCKQRQKLLMDLLSDESFDVVEDEGEKTTTETTD